MSVLDWIGVIFLCVVIAIIALASDRKRANEMPENLWTNPHYTGSKLAIAGQWITRCTDNSKVCRLRKDVDSGMAWRPEDCDSWTEPSPLNGEKIAETPARYWAAAMPGFVWLHFADGWRPQQPSMTCPK
jgi:hypothetical protein